MFFMKRLLVCIDGSSPYTESCLKYTQWLLEKTQAGADILYVSDTHLFNVSMLADISGSLGVQPYQGLYSQLKEVETQKVRVIKKSALDFFKNNHLEQRVKFHNMEGLLVDAYESFENNEVGLDLVIVGKRGEDADFASEHLGSSMERLVRASQKPCLVVPRKYIPIKHVLIAYDGSPSVNKAIQFFVRSPLFKDVQLDLVMVTEEDDASGEQNNLMNKALQALKEAHYNVHAEILSGDPSDTIVNYSLKNNIDLLVMGAYGHSAIRHLLIGSTTTDLMRRCKFSVLLFR